MSPVTQLWPDLHRSLLDHRRWRPASWYHLAWVPWNAGNKYSCAQWVHEKKLTLGKSQIITWFNHQLLHKKSVIALWFLCTLWMYTIQYIYIHIYSPNPIQKKKKNNLPSFQKPTSPCNSHSPTAVSPWGALMQSIKGIPLHLGIGAITPVKASDEQVSVAVRGDWNVFNPFWGAFQTTQNGKWVPL